MFDRLLNAALGTVRIAQELTAMGIPTPRSRPAWTASTVYRILTNPLYAGTFYSMKYRYQKVSLQKKVRFLRPASEWIPIIAPPIVEQAVWTAAQEQLHHNRTTAVRNKRWHHLLSGLAHCARCGRRLKSIISGSQSQPYYVCPGRPVCDARLVPATLLDQVVWEELFALFHQKNLVQTISTDYQWDAGQQVAAQAFRQLTARQDELLRRRQMVADWFSHQTISADEAAGLLQAVRSELQVVTERLMTAQEKVVAQSTACQLSEMAAFAEEEWTATRFAAAEQSAALHAVLSKVMVERLDTTQRKNSRPDLSVRLLFR
jgi:site-specific DNA recombinase